MKKSNFQFTNPFLTRLRFDVNNEFLLHEKLDNDLFEMKHNFNTEIRRNKKENKAYVALSLKINENENKAPFFLDISIASNFIWNDNISEEMVNSMLKYNAPALLLGYMRPIVASITNSSVFPVYNLPFINFRE